MFNDTGSDPLGPEMDTIWDWQDGLDRIVLPQNLQGTVTVTYGNFNGVGPDDTPDDLRRGRRE